MINILQSLSVQGQSGRLPREGRKCSQRQDLLKISNREAPRGKGGPALTSIALMRSSGEYRLDK
jgi:hypothetical protein